jgi:hypothetical protein
VSSAELVNPPAGDSALSLRNLHSAPEARGVAGSYKALPEFTGTGDIGEQLGAAVPCRSHSRWQKAKRPAATWPKRWGMWLSGSKPRFTDPPTCDKEQTNENKPTR